MIQKYIPALRKIRLFDVIIASAVLVAAIAFVYFFFRSNTYVSVTVRVGDDNVVYMSPGTKPWLNMFFHPGMTEKDGLGNVAARVTDVWSYKKVAATDVVYLTLDVLATLNRASGQYVYRGKPVAVGSTLRVYLDGVVVDGLITGIQGMKDPREHKTLIVSARLRDETPVYPQSGGVHPEIADALQVGQTTTDNKGGIVIKILEKRVEDAKQLVLTQNGTPIVTTNPLRKDVYLTLELHTTKLNGKYYIFDDVPVLIEQPIPLNTGSYLISPMVTGFLSEK